MLAVEESQDTLTAHILAVDDDPSVRKVICNYLGDNDIRVTALASGREIADVMAREVIDLLVLDWRLPGEDGLAIARRLGNGRHVRDDVDDHVLDVHLDSRHPVRRRRE